MKKNNLHTIKASGFKTPNDYFESFDERVLSKIDAQPHLDAIKSSGFNAPKGYFETFDNHLLETIKKEQDTKAIPLFSWKKAAYISGVAASFLLMFQFYFNNSDSITFDELETASIENYLYQEDLSVYDIASYLSEDDLTKDSFIDNKLSEESLEDYLLEHTTIEDLIID